MTSTQTLSSVDRHAESTRLMKIARDAALSVGDPLRAAFRAAMTVDYKVDLHDVVTIHDKQSEAAIRDFILTAAPDSALLGEEGGSVGSGRIKWYVDPIDGTSNFARGLAFWCVSIGAMVDGEIVAGVVYDPIAKQLFAADLTGVWLNEGPIRSRAVPEEAHATLITGYPVARDFRLDGKEAALKDFGTLVEAFSTLRRPGSAALTLCHVAAGWCDAATGFGVNPWDVTAAILILRNAGGSYRPLGLGRVPQGQPANMYPGYVAIGAGGNYPTLNAVADGISSRREIRAGSGRD
nr:inositol monophosphatase family protein [uncultured Devosia sp.]